MQNYTLELFIGLEVIYFWFSLGGNLDFLDFFQKKFYNINYTGREQMVLTDLNCVKGGKRLKGSRDILEWRKLFFDCSLPSLLQAWMYVFVTMLPTYLHIYLPNYISTYLGIFPFICLLIFWLASVGLLINLTL